MALLRKFIEKMNRVIHSRVEVFIPPAQNTPDISCIRRKPSVSFFFLNFYSNYKKKCFPFERIGSRNKKRFELNSPLC